MERFIKAVKDETALSHHAFISTHKQPVSDVEQITLHLWSRLVVCYQKLEEGM